MSEMHAIQSENLAAMVGKPLIAIVEDGGEWVVNQHAEDGSTFPPCRYQSKRAAAARMLQLLGIGPVAPQTHPERACIGTIEALSQ